MKDFFQNWLDQHGSGPGVLLCGISLPDRTALGILRSECPIERLEEILRHLAEFSQTLGQHRVTASRLLWRFENTQLHWAIRPDNVCLAVFSPADAPAHESIDRLIADFLQLRSS